MHQSTIYKYILSVAALMLLLFMAGCTGSNEQQSDARYGVEDLQTQGRQMPSFSLPSPLAMKSVLSSESLQGKVVLVDFFASWCRSCIEEIPLLKKLQDRYGTQEFVIIALAVDPEDMEGLKNLIRKQKLNYQVLLADEKVKKDFGGIAILPTMFLVDREGKILKKYSGHIERDSLFQDIRQILAP
jgi:thiol-disulfide isomerase/thioredoxin